MLPVPALCHHFAPQESYYTKPDGLPACRYEGTGRSLSLKLLSQLRQQSPNNTLKATAKNSTGATNDAVTSGGSASAASSTSIGARTLREVSLDEPIRYGPNDPVEAWLSQLLCLDAAEHAPPAPAALPHPDECELFYVERDTLFSGHRVSEGALQQMMALYVASHYKNTPNDLLLMADAPAHHLFALTAPVPDKGAVRFGLQGFAVLGLYRLSPTCLQALSTLPGLCL